MVIEGARWMTREQFLREAKVGDRAFCIGDSDGSHFYSGIVSDYSDWNRVFTRFMVIRNPLPPKRDPVTFAEAMRACLEDGKRVRMGEGTTTYRANASGTDVLASTGGVISLSAHKINAAWEILDD